METPWGTGVLERPIVCYTRRWERWLAVIWPTKRRHLRAMQRLADMTPSDVQREYNRALTQTLAFGSAQMHLQRDTPPV